MNYINLTPHNVTYYRDGAVVVDIPKSENPIRIETVLIKTENAEYTTCTYQFVPGVELPKPVEGTTYIVSTPTLMALLTIGIWRPDFVSPDTNGTPVRHPETGMIIGVTAFMQLPPIQISGEQRWECLCGNEDIDTLDIFLDRKEKRMRAHCVCQRCKRVFDRVYEFSYNIENTKTHYPFFSKKEN